MTFLGWMRRRFRLLSGLAGAVSHADMGPYRGAPRNPDLRVGDERAYSTIRYSTEVAHTTAEVVPGDCARCGRPFARSHELRLRAADGTALPAGAVRFCEHCAPASWLVQSRMRAAARARAQGRRNVV